MNPSPLQVTKLQSLIRGVLVRLRLRRNPKFSRLFRKKLDVSVTGTYDRAGMWDFGEKELVEYSERLYRRRKMGQGRDGEGKREEKKELTEQKDPNQHPDSSPPSLPQSSLLLTTSLPHSSPEPDSLSFPSQPLFPLHKTLSNLSNEPLLPTLPPADTPLPDPPDTENEEEKLQKTHFERKASNYRSYRESNATVSAPMPPIEKAESPVAALEGEKVKFFSKFEEEIYSLGENVDLEPEKTDFPMEKPETPHIVPPLPSQFFPEIPFLHEKTTENDENEPEKSDFPVEKIIKRPETPTNFSEIPLNSQFSTVFPQFRYTETAENSPKPTNFPILKSETLKIEDKMSSVDFEKVNLMRNEREIEEFSEPKQTYFPPVHSETPSIPPSPVSFHSVLPGFPPSPSFEMQDSLPTPTTFPPPPPQFKPETPLSSHSPSVSFPVLVSNPAVIPTEMSESVPEKTKFPSISPLPQAVTANPMDSKPAQSVSRPKTPVTSLFFQPHPAPLQSSHYHSPPLDTPTDIPSFPPSQHASSRKAVDLPMDSIGFVESYVPLSVSFRGVEKGKFSRPEPPPLIMQGIDLRSKHDTGKLRSKSHTKAWSMSQPETFLGKSTLVDLRSGSKSRRVQTTARTKTPEQRLLRWLSPYDPGWNKRVLEKVFRIGVEVRLRPNGYLPDLIIRRLRKSGGREVHPGRMREIEEMELL